jgi:lipid II:glycine glycyltransferase (peptidoglycan interpeptide bridge formation enzyme)
VTSAFETCPLIIVLGIVSAMKPLPEADLDGRVPALSDRATSHLEYSVSETVSDPEWDDFVFSHAEPHHEQTSLWAAVRQRFGWYPVRLVVRRGGRIVAGAQVLEHRIAPLITVGYLSRGPLLTPGIDEGGFLSALKRLAAKRGLAYLAVSLPYDAHTLAGHMERTGFTLRPEGLPPAVWAKATTVIDLDKNLEALFSSLRSTMRKHVRRGLRDGIVVRHGSKADLNDFKELMLAHCRRRGISSNIPGGEFLDLLWDSLAKGGHIKLLVADVDRKPVCALILIACGRWVRAWRIGWSGDHEDKHPSAAIYWEAIKWAQESGYGYFDVLGIDRDDAEALLGGHDRSEAFKCPITFFKMGLGGKILLLPGEYCFFPTPLLNMAFRSLGRPFLESRLFARMASALHARRCATGDRLTPPVA